MQTLSQNKAEYSSTENTVPMYVKQVRVVLVGRKEKRTTSIVLNR